MAQLHPQDLPAAGSVESTLRQAATNSMIADADLATDKATVLANLVTRNAAIIAGARPDLYPLYLALKAAINLGYNILGSTPMISGSLATVYTACELGGPKWAPGFSAAI